MDLRGFFVFSLTVSVFVDTIKMVETSFGDVYAGCQDKECGTCLDLIW